MGRGILSGTSGISYEGGTMDFGTQNVIPKFVRKKEE